MNDLDPLDPLSRQLLDAARDGHAPSPGNRERVRRKVVARVGATAFFIAAIATASTGLLKATAIVAVVLFGGGLGYYATQRTEPVAVSAPSPAPEPMPADVPPPVIEPVSAPAPASSEPEPEPKPLAASAPSPRLLPSQHSSTIPSLAEETALLFEAQSALRDGDTQHALTILDRHAERFPSGTMTEEREASRVLALCKLGRTAEGRRAAEAFVVAHPRSPALGRVRSACAAADSR